MKKKILLIISNMESGGVSKSMSSLLNVIDTQTYEVDCFVLSPQGIFMDSIPEDIHLITDKKTALFFEAFPGCVFRLLNAGYLWAAFIRVLAAFFMLFNKGIGGWLLSRQIYRIRKNYDLAVDYNGQHQLYYLIDKIQAKKKLTFFHSDYKKWPYYYSMDQRYMPLTDRIYSISDKCVDSLRKYFPEESEKISLFENISSPRTIKHMTEERVVDSLDNGFKTLITIGHVTEAKGILLAIRAARLLQDQGLDFKWYFLGNDSEAEPYRKLAKDLKVEHRLVFMGLRSNPYPYIWQADLVVHPSQFEGKSIALDEAKILCKAIVVTNFSTVRDQFTDRVNASICHMTAEDLAEKIEELLNNDGLRHSYEEYLAEHVTDNSAEVDKLYRLINY